MGFHFKSRLAKLKPKMKRMIVTWWFPPDWGSPQTQHCPAQSRWDSSGTSSSVCININIAIWFGWQIIICNIYFQMLIAKGRFQWTNPLRDKNEWQMNNIKNFKIKSPLSWSCFWRLIETFHYIIATNQK